MYDIYITNVINISNISIKKSAKIPAYIKGECKKIVKIIDNKAIHVPNVLKSKNNIIFIIFTRFVDVLLKLTILVIRFDTRHAFFNHFILLQVGFYIIFFRKEQHPNICLQLVAVRRKCARGEGKSRVKDTGPRELIHTEKKIRNNHYHNHIFSYDLLRLFVKHVYKLSSILQKDMKKSLK